MASQFGGIAVEQPVSQFGGVAVDQQDALTAEEPGALTKIGGEFAAGVNRTVIGGLDFFTADQVNNILELSGSEKRVPTFSEQAAKIGATQGGFMEEGLARDVVATAGETAALGAGVGGGLRTAATQLPLIQRGGESVKAGVLRELGRPTARQDITAGALAGAGAELGAEYGGETGELVGSLAAPLAPTAARVAGSEGVRRAVRGGEDALVSVRRTLADFAEARAVPNIGQAIDSPGLQAAQTRSSKFFGGSPLIKSIQTAAQKLQLRRDEIAGRISGKADTTKAGRTIERAIKGEGGFIDRFHLKSNELWSPLDTALKNKQVKLKNTRPTLDNLIREGALAKELNNPTIARINQLAKEGDDIVSYNELKDLRSSLGRRIAQNDLTSDIPQAELRQLYGAVTNDIKTVAESQGKLGMFNRANNYTRGGQERIGDFLQKTINKGDFVKIYDAVTRGGEGVQTVNAFKRSMKPAEWNVVAANVVRQLGRPTPGKTTTVEGDDFSFVKFVTDWNKLGDVKKAMFSGSPELDKYRNNLNRLSRMGATLKADVLAGANPSETAAALSQTAALGTALGAASQGNYTLLKALVGAAAANKTFAHVMTEPKLVNWLAKSTRLSDAKLPAHIARLGVIANPDKPGEVEAVEDIFNAFSDSPTR